MNTQFSISTVEPFFPQVVGSLPPSEEFHVPVYNQMHQEQVVAVENPAVQEQVIIQEIPQVSIVERTQEHILATVQPHVLFQEIPEVHVVERIQASQTTLNTSSTSTSRCVPAATHAATAYSVPILHFSGDNVGIQSCVLLNDVLSCLFRNRIVPQTPEQIVETVNALPQEWISQHIVDIPVAWQRNRPARRSLVLRLLRTRLSTLLYQSWKSNLLP